MHRASIAFAFAFTCATATHAAEVKILTAGAMKAVVLELVPQFEKETGYKAVVDNDTAGGLAKRIEGGEAFDLAVVTPGVLNDLAKKAGIDISSISRMVGQSIPDGHPPTPLPPAPSKGALE